MTYKFDKVQLANQLEAMQLAVNDGNRIDCIQTIVSHLRCGLVSQAMNTYVNVYERIARYDSIRDVLDGVWHTHNPKLGCH